MDDPCLGGMVLLVQPEDLAGAFDVMDDQRLLVLLREQDVLLEGFQLEPQGLLMKAVDASLPDGGEFVFFQKGFKGGYIIARLPRMDAISWVQPCEGGTTEATHLL